MLPLQLLAQDLPGEGSALNYRIIGFSFPGAPANTTHYRLEIAEGNYPEATAFEQHINKTINCNGSRAIAEVPAFGKEYTWRAVALATGGIATKMALHHFITLVVPRINDCEMRLKVTTPFDKPTDKYAFSDGNRALYNMKGDPVWFMPNIDGTQPNNFDIRDLKLSPTGSITFLGNNWPYEINYDGKVLWAAPKNPNAGTQGEGTFHHEFVKLNNGHYMVFGNELVAWHKCKAGDCDSNSIVSYNSSVKPDSTQILLIPFCTIIEYDAMGNIAWKWRSVNYFKHSDIFNHEGINGYANIDAHANAFYFDEKTKKIYVSFKDINRIVVINYPAGNVANEYGAHFTSGVPEITNPQFSEQHAVRVSAKGYLYLFDNDINHASRLPSIVMFKEQGVPNAPLKELWSAQCAVGSEKIDADISRLGRQGGIATELPDNKMFVSMCFPYWNMFIMGLDKKVIWAATPQKYNITEKKWVANPSYRSSIINSRKELEQLIWNAEKNGINNLPGVQRPIKI